MPGDSSEPIVLDRSLDVWVGRFPGVGSIRIHVDGRTEIDVDSSLDTDGSSDEDKRQALLFGWAEPLSLVRRGFVLVHGLAAHHPDRDAALLVGGDVHDTAVAAAGLARRGWSLMGDRVVPLVLEEHRILVHPRSAPIVMARARAEAAGLAYRRLREDSNAVAVDVRRHGVPSTLAGIAFAGVRRPHEERMRPATGHGRFDIARRLMGTGALFSVDGNVHDAMQHTVRLASIPSGEWRFDHPDPDAAFDDLIAWWEEL